MSCKGTVRCTPIHQFTYTNVEWLSNISETRPERDNIPAILPQSGKMAGKSKTDNGADFDAIDVCAIGSMIGIRRCRDFIVYNYV